MEQEEESDRQKFVRLATKRVNNALKYIRLISNLSNTSNYRYKDEDIEKIFKILENEIAECRHKFEQKKKVKQTFTLD